MIKRLEKIVPKLLEKMNIPGVAIGFISNHEISSINPFGFANKEQQIPITEHTIFAVASISKSVTTWGVMKLVEEGRLDLDAPAEKYLTRWHLPPSEFENEQVSIRRLLSHTAGFQESEYTSYNPNYEPLSIEEILSGRLPGPIDEEELKYCEKWNLIPKKEGTPVKVRKEPGKEFIYANDGYLILQLIIEEITKQTFSDYMKKEILTPFGMNFSSYEKTDLDAALFATPYNEESKPLPLYVGTIKAAGGLCATIIDMLTFALGGMRGPNRKLPGREILKPSTLDQMYSKLIHASDDFGYDWYYGLGHYISEIKGLKVIQHSGGIIGWRSMMIFIPEKGEGIVVLINSSGGNSLWANLVTRWSREVL